MPETKKDDDKKFPQVELDQHIADRIKRESAKYADYDDLKAKAAKLADIDEKAKDENQKLLDRIAAAEKKATEADQRVGEAEARALRLEVAAAKGLNAAQAKRLTGTTREELDADADDLIESFPSTDTDTKTKGAPPARPREDLRGGGSPDETPVETNPAKLAESVPRL